MKIEIRPCSEKDLKLLREISIETFDETFRPFNTDDNMNKYLEELFNPEKILADLRNSGIRYYFAETAGSCAGYMKLNESGAQSDIHDPASMEIERIYVRNNWKGNGLGRAMVEFAVELAKAGKKDYVWLGVWDNNLPAIKFYERMGFGKIGEHPFRLGDDIQTDYIMRMDI